MKNILYKLSSINIIVLLMITMYGCSDFLTTPPRGSLSKNVLLNERGAEGALIAAYSLLNGSSVFTSLQNYAGIASDEQYPGTTGLIGRSAKFQFYTFSPQFSELNSIWKFNYKGVQRANNVIRLLDNPKMQISKSEGERIRAEAQFLRGLYTLRLKMLFKNIPYVNETVTYANKNYLVSNQKPVWPKIEADFKYASKHLKDIAPHPGNANKWTAKSMLARTYMQEIKFKKALPLLINIINNGVTSSGEDYRLEKCYNWNFMVEHKNGPEAVFQVQMSVKPSRLRGNIIQLGQGPSGCGASTYDWAPPSIGFANHFQTNKNGLPYLNSFWKHPIKTDIGVKSSEPFTPYQGTLDPRLDWLVGRRGIPYLDYGVDPGQAWVRVKGVDGPYVSKLGQVWDEGAGSKVGVTNNSPYNIMRFAGLLLLAAEAAVEVGSLSKAEKFVNRVRKRAANPDCFVKEYIDLSDPTAGFSNVPAAHYKTEPYPPGMFKKKGKQWALHAVRFERILELGLQNKRYFDLKRYNKEDPGYMANVLNTALKRNLKVDGINKSYFSTGNGFTRGKDEYYPIPQEQIDLSVDPKTGKPTLIQNPGWR